MIRHLRSFIAPVVVIFVLPYLILTAEQRPPGQSWLAPSSAQRVAGGLIAAAGFVMLISAIRLFILIGQGTIMPWDPTRKMIVAGLYHHVRNPMILSLLIILTGEAILFSSLGIALLAAAFFVINTVYFIYAEEPGLEKRFGAEYREYKRNVSRWIPRLKPWRPD